MDTSKLSQVSTYEWRIEPEGPMRVPGVLYGDESLLRDMDDKVYEQVRNVACLPGIVGASFAMPDAHWGYGFPIGGVAAFDSAEGGVISAGGVGFDISCGVRTFTTGLTNREINPKQADLADSLFKTIPAGVGSTGEIRLDAAGMDAMLAGGALWAFEEGFGLEEDLERIEERGVMAGADPGAVSEKAKKRQRDEMGTLGSGNHYLEVQEIAEIYDASTAKAYGLEAGRVVVTIHCGSRGLGHQIGTEFLREMAGFDAEIGLTLPDRELACAPVESDIGRRYLGAMRAGINCALANRQIIGHLTRSVFAELFPGARLSLLFDVSHNTCKVETHPVEGRSRALYLHRKGATRAFGPGHPDLPEPLRETGQPVLIGGSMGTGSHIMVGVSAGEERAFSSACHGAGRRMSRHKAAKKWHGRQVVVDLAKRGILVRSPTRRGIAEEAPGAYKDVDAVALAAEKAGLARRVARLTPMVCIKG